MRWAWRDASLLLAMTLLAYANALDGPFQFDDWFVIVNADAVKSVAAWWADLGHGLRPLLKLSYLLDGKTGLGARGYHLSNVAIHAVNVLLVWRLALHAASAWCFEQRSQRHAALLTAAVFALHPANTEAVTYICGRSVSLMSLLFLCGLLAWHRGWTLVALMLLPLALAVKEPAATLPPTLLLWQRFVGSTSVDGIAGRAWWRHAPFWLLPAALALWLLPRSNYSGFLLGSLGARSVADNLLLQIDSVIDLLKLALLLRPPNIDPQVQAASAPMLALEALLLLALLTGALRLRHRRPWLAFGALWFVLQLLPTNSLLPRNDLVNDRQLYLAGIGLWLALVFELVARRPPLRLLLVGGVLLALLLGALTHRRNRDYASEIALWSATVRSSPDKARPWNNLGFAYQAAGCRKAAIAAYGHSIALDPSEGRAFNNRRALLSLPEGEDGPGCPSTP